MRRVGSIAASLLGALAACATPASPPAPPEPTPIKDDTSIPPELGQFEDEVKLTSWNSSGPPHQKGIGLISFVEVWTVLAEPANSGADIVKKAQFVRFTIPRRGISPREYEGGTARLLMSIFQSEQHDAVREAAMAALRGVHLSVLNSSFRPDVCARLDPCPHPVLPDHAPEYVELARSILTVPLTVPLSPRSRADIYWLIRILMINETDLPEGFETLKAEFVDAFIDQRVPLSLLWGWRAGDRNSALVAAALRPMLQRDPDLLPAAIEFLGRRSELTKEVLAELEALRAALDAAPEDKLHRQIRKSLNKVLKL